MSFFCEIKVGIVADSANEIKSAESSAKIAESCKIKSKKSQESRTKNILDSANRRI
ncbi:hypothetical protein ACWIUD_00485 [Helicobacter sp. 23-1044]